MGGVCSGGMVRRNEVYEPKNTDYSGKLNEMDYRGKRYDSGPLRNDSGPLRNDSGPLKNDSGPLNYDSGPLNYDSGELRIPSAPARGGGKVPQMGSLLGRAGIVGLERAVEVLDTLGSSMSNLNPSGGFASGITSQGNRISILAFEVANTIVRGANLLHSLSNENIKNLKEVILHSDGVQCLVSTDMEELLRIAAADKREEFNVFSREVTRFGDKCKDPQWHNLDRYFQKFNSDFTMQKQLKEEADITIQELTSLAQYTAELYHEFHALDRFEQDYRRKLEEVESLHLPRKGEGLVILHSELKHQRKLVRSLKKKSLWSKSLEEVVEKLVDIVTFIHQEILEAFGNNAMEGTSMVSDDTNHSPQRLGASGLALHYANVINQIDNIVSRPSSLPPNMRDTLYHGLPLGVKAGLRSRLQSFDCKEELTVPQIKAEMEKTLHWLVPVATNTTKAHQGFGWVGEWANTGSEFNKKTSAQNNVIRLQTLYHAEREKTDMYILELATWLHHLISTVRHRDFGLKPIAPVRSPSRKVLVLSSEPQRESSPTSKSKTQLSQVDRDMLKEVSSRRLNPGISKSQELQTVTKKKDTKVLGLSRSSGSSPSRAFCPNQYFQRTQVNVLDAMDGLGITY